MKRALLLLVGGRQVPNLLTAQHLRPDIIVPVASHDALLEGREWSRVAPPLAVLCPNGLREPIPVDAFGVEETRAACQSALDEYPDAEWFFNITCGTKLMGFGAYEVARKYNISSWYLDTATRRVVTLAGRQPTNNLYFLNVADYMALYGRKPKIADDKPPPEVIDFAKYLAHHCEDIPSLKRKARVAQRPGTVVIRPFRMIRQFCKMAHGAGFMSSYHFMSDGSVHCDIPDGRLWRFISGGWLEIYAWVVAQEARCFDDCRYGLEIPSDGGKNEIDLAITYAASLLIAECKTDDNPFTSENIKYLDKLNSIASMIGANYVARLFICTQKPMLGNKEAYDNFCQQADDRQIVIVTGNRLCDLGNILCQEAGADRRQRPTYDHR